MTSSVVTLALAAVQAAGTGHIAFSGKLKATLAVDNAALSGHVFGNEIDFSASATSSI